MKVGEWSNNALALASDLSEGSIRQALQENGTAPKIDTVEKIANGLGVDLGWLLGVNEQPVNYDLLQALVQLFLESYESSPLLRQQFAHMIARAYEDALLHSISAQDLRDLQLLTAGPTRELAELRSSQE